MFTDPVVTIDGTANNLVRTTFATPSRFQNASGDLVLEINQSRTKSAERFNARLTRTAYGADLLNPALTREYTRQYWFGSSMPLNGIGISDAVGLKDIAGFLAWLGQTDTMTRLHSGQS